MIKDWAIEEIGRDLTHGLDGTPHIPCDGAGCDAMVDFRHVPDRPTGHPERPEETLGWLVRESPRRSWYDSHEIERYCPRCRVTQETEQATLSELAAPVE